MHNILITYGTRPLAQRVANRILSAQVIFATCEEIPTIFTSAYHKIPHAANPIFAHELLKFCLDRGVPYILPLDPLECKTLAQTKVLFDEYGINILLPDSLMEENIVQNPPSTLDLELFDRGKSLFNGSTNGGLRNGLYASLKGQWTCVTL